MAFTIDAFQFIDAVETATMTPAEIPPLPTVRPTDPFPPLDPPTVDSRKGGGGDWNSVSLMSRLRPLTDS